MKITVIAFTLGSGSSSSSSSSGSDSEGGDDEEKELAAPILDATETNLIALRRTIYLTIQGRKSIEFFCPKNSPNIGRKNDLSPVS